LTKVLYYGIIIIAVLAVLPTLGISPSGLLVAGGIAGIVIGIASQSVVSNLLAGLFLMVERPMKIGQSVNIAGIAGVVEDIRIISTTLRTFEGLYVRIPNEKVFTTNITNYVEHVARRLEYIVGIRYSDDADKAIGIIKNLHEEHPLTLKSPTPDIFVDNLGDNAVNIIVRLWVPSTEWYGVKKELLWKIKRALEDQGIEIAFPQRTVWFAKELRKQEIENSEFSESGTQ
jgi:small-conductance mechanosensitive channel